MGAAFISMLYLHGDWRGHMSIIWLEPDTNKGIPKIQILAPSLLPLHSLMTMKYMDSFGINSTKYYVVYLNIQTISNKKIINYRVVDLVEYYTFHIKFVVAHHMTKL